MEQHDHPYPVRPASPLLQFCSLWNLESVLVLLSLLALSPYVQLEALFLTVVLRWAASARWIYRTRVCAEKAPCCSWKMGCWEQFEVLFQQRRNNLTDSSLSFHLFTASHNYYNIYSVYFIYYATFKGWMCQIHVLDKIICV